jgi:hypothetical protein
MSFLHGNMADQPGITLRGYANADLSDFTDFSDPGEILYAPAPNDDLSDNIKNKYMSKISLLEDSLKNVNIELLLQPNKTKELKKEEIIAKIDELKNKMYTEFEDKGIEYTSDGFFEQLRVSKLSKPIWCSFDNVPNNIISEFKKSGNVNVINNFKETIKKQPMSKFEFCARYCSKNQEKINEMWTLTQDDLDKQLKVIQESRDLELKNPIYSKKPEEITEKELMEYFERNWLKPGEFPVKSTCWLLNHKFPNAFNADCINWKEYSEFMEPEGKNWEYYRPMLRKYYYSFPNNPYGELFSPDMSELSKAIDMEYDLLAKFVKTNNIKPKHVIAGKWYLLDNPGISFNEYLDTFVKTDEYLQKDFLIAKDYLFENILTGFKKYKSTWKYHPFEFKCPGLDTESESDLDSIPISESNEIKNVKIFFESVYLVMSKPEFIWGLISGYLIEKIF